MGFLLTLMVSWISSLTVETTECPVSLSESVGVYFRLSVSFEVSERYGLRTFINLFPTLTGPCPLLWMFITFDFFLSTVMFLLVALSRRQLGNLSICLLSEVCASSSTFAVLKRLWICFLVCAG